MTVLLDNVTQDMSRADAVLLVVYFRMENLNDRSHRVTQRKHNRGKLQNIAPL